MADPPWESILFCPVPEAEPLVWEHRRRFDPSARAGVPAHISLLAPFLPADRVDAGVHTRLARVLAAVPPFRYRLTEVRWFGEDVMWLAPEPAGLFADLIERLAAEFGVRPYGGVHAEIVPHLTVVRGAPAEARRIAPELRNQLPLAAEASRVQLMVGSDLAGWRLESEHRLGGGADPVR